MALLVALAALVALMAAKGTGTLHEMLYPRLYRDTSFPEDRFPPRSETDFRARTERGYDRMSNASVVICGISKDDCDSLPRTIRRIEKTGGLFESYQVVVFENDSTDGTRDLLREWEDSNPAVTVLSESLQSRPGFPAERFERMALCRNRYLDHIAASDELSRSDYVIVVDMDLTGGWSLDGIASSFAESEWDAMASNSIGYHNLRRTYYDTAALRPPSVLNQGWFNRLIGEAWQLRRGDPPVPVESAFGGLCLYSMQALETRRYSGRVDGEPVCEHVALHRGSDMRCFLNPSQITVVGTQTEKDYQQKSPWAERMRRLFLNW